MYNYETIWTFVKLQLSTKALQLVIKIRIHCFSKIFHEDKDIGILKEYFLESKRTEESEAKINYSDN